MDSKGFSHRRERLFQPPGRLPVRARIFQQIPRLPGIGREVVQLRPRRHDQLEAAVEHPLERAPAIGGQGIPARQVDGARSAASQARQPRQRQAERRGGGREPRRTQHGRGEPARRRPPRGSPGPAARRGRRESAERAGSRGRGRCRGSSSPCSSNDSPWSPTAAMIQRSAPPGRAESSRPISRSMAAPRRHSVRRREPWLPRRTGVWIVGIAVVDPEEKRLVRGAPFDHSSAASVISRAVRSAGALHGPARPGPGRHSARTRGRDRTGGRGRARRRIPRSRSRGTKRRRRAWACCRRARPCRCPDPVLRRSEPGEQRRVSRQGQRRRGDRLGPAHAAGREQRRAQACVSPGRRKPRAHRPGSCPGSAEAHSVDLRPARTKRCRRSLSGRRPGGQCERRFLQVSSLVSNPKGPRPSHGRRTGPRVRS